MTSEAKATYETAVYMHDREDMWDVVERIARRDAVHGVVVLSVAERDVWVKWTRYLEDTWVEGTR